MEPTPKVPRLSDSLSAPARYGALLTTVSSSPTLTERVAPPVVAPESVRWRLRLPFLVDSSTHPLIASLPPSALAVISMSMRRHHTCMPAAHITRYGGSIVAALQSVRSSSSEPPQPEPESSSSSVSSAIWGQARMPRIWIQLFQLSAPVNTSKVSAGSGYTAVLKTIMATDAANTPTHAVSDSVCVTTRMSPATK